MWQCVCVYMQLVHVVGEEGGEDSRKGLGRRERDLVRLGEREEDRLKGVWRRREEDVGRELERDGEGAERGELRKEWGVTLRSSICSYLD